MYHIKYYTHRIVWVSSFKKILPYDACPQPAARTSFKSLMGENFYAAFETAAANLKLPCRFLQKKSDLHWHSSQESYIFNHTKWMILGPIYYDGLLATSMSCYLVFLRAQPMKVWTLGSRTRKWSYCCAYAPRTAQQGRYIVSVFFAKAT